MLFLLSCYCCSFMQCISWSPNIEKNWLLTCSVVPLLHINLITHRRWIGVDHYQTDGTSEAGHWWMKSPYMECFTSVPVWLGIDFTCGGYFKVSHMLPRQWAEAIFSFAFLHHIDLEEHAHSELCCLCVSGGLTHSTKPESVTEIDRLTALRLA